MKRVAELRGNGVGPAAGSEHVHHGRRCRALPGSVVHGVRPELALAGSPSSLFEHRQRSFIAEHAREAVDRLQLQVIQPFEPPRGAIDPVHQRRTVEVDAVASKHLGLPVERHVPRELGDHHPGDQRGRGHAGLDQPRRCGRLHHRALAGAAAVFRPHGAQHAQDCRYDVERLVHTFADAMHLAGAARAGGAVGLDHLLAAGQVLGQAADVAPRRFARRP